MNHYKSLKIITMVIKKFTTIKSKYFSKKNNDGFIEAK